MYVLTKNWMEGKIDRKAGIAEIHADQAVCAGITNEFLKGIGRDKEADGTIVLDKLVQTLAVAASTDAALITALARKGVEPVPGKAEGFPTIASGVVISDIMVRLRVKVIPATT